MQETDREEFTRILKGVLEVYGKTMSSDAWRIWWAALANSDLSAVRMALSKHVKESPYPPKPADILKLCTADDGRPGVEEAWAMLPQDEDGSVVWTDEMAVAYRAASPLLLDGDRIAARMVFKETYQREIARAKDSGTPVCWRLSAGREFSGREGALLEAVQKGRITGQMAVRLLPESTVLLSFLQAGSMNALPDPRVSKLVSEFASRMQATK